MLLAEHGLDLSGVRHLLFLRASRRRFHSLLSTPALALTGIPRHRSATARSRKLSFVSPSLLALSPQPKLWGVGQSVVQEC